MSRQKLMLFFERAESGEQQPYDQMLLPEHYETPHHGDQIIMKCPSCDKIHYYSVVSVGRRFSVDDHVEMIFIHVVSEENLKGHIPGYEKMNLN